MKLYKKDFDKFTADMTRRGRVLITIKRHEQNFKYIKDWLRAKHLNRKNLDLFVIHFLKGRQASTVNSAISTLKCFCRFLFERKLIKDELHLYLKYIKNDPFSPILLSIEDVNEIIKCPRTWSTYGGIDRKKYDFFFELMARCGLRRNETMKLRFQDFDFDNNTIRISGKGRRVREVAIPSIMKIRLIGWFEEHSFKTDDYIFQSPNGNCASSAMFTAELKKRLEVLGLDKSIHLHTFRHTFATYATRADKNPFKVMKALGHANIQTTLKYTHLVVDDVRDVFEDHPLNRLPEKQLPGEPERLQLLVKNKDYRVN
ncbi:tyrosine-type recombinase/integrase [Candidatus Curtissbacteria bacterium]|nr:tyrosine-type recombinase/integrase [Candidatus Curtissbacteria bacterium]